MLQVVAVIGASSDRRKFGNKALRAFLRRGYTVLPINPHEKQIEGQTAFASVRDVPGNIELATLYVPPEIGESVIEDLPAKNVQKLWVNPGAGSPRLIARARQLGLEPVQHCSIIAIGESPADY
jgi:predicted CoA-binding protein